MTEPKRNNASVIAFALAGLAMLYILSPFAVVLLTAVVSAVVTFPTHTRLADRLGPYGAATAMTLAVILVILTPLGFALFLVVRQAVDVAQGWITMSTTGELQPWLLAQLAQLPEPWGDWLRDPARIDTAEGLLSDAIGTVINRVGPLVTGVVAALAAGTVQAGVFILTLFTLYVEGPALAATLDRLSPLPGVQTKRLYRAFRQFSSNVVVGMLATAVGQGGIASLGFWLAGASNVALLGFVSAIASQVPVVGSATVWVPVAISLGGSGRWGAALFVTAWSLALTASVDNVIKPIIYRKGLRVHPTLVLLSMLGGLSTIGPAGLLGGPLLLVTFLTLLWFQDPKNDGDEEPTPVA